MVPLSGSVGSLFHSTVALRILLSALRMAVTLTVGRWVSESALDYAHSFHPYLLIYRVSYFVCGLNSSVSCFALCFPVISPPITSWCFVVKIVPFSDRSHFGFQVEVNPYVRLDLRVYRDHLATACRDTICMRLCDAYAHKPSNFHRQYGYRSLVPSSVNLPSAEPLFKKKEPKKDLDLLGHKHLKKFVVAWNDTGTLKGELLGTNLG